MDLTRVGEVPPGGNDVPPSLTVDSGPDVSGSLGIGIGRLGQGLMAAIAAHLDAGGDMAVILRVMVVQPEAPLNSGLPNVSGRYQVVEGGIRFAPYFPFEPGMTYRAVFDPEPLRHSELPNGSIVDFSLPRDGSALPTQVSRILPSGDDLPENLLRLYVCFSNPMQRGHAQDEIMLLGPGGEPAVDALYRAPVELWDRAMRVLTVLLDPGRLKRGVGPNRELGPPLAIGRVYTLVVGSGMTDLFGRRLDHPAHKRFCVTEAVRQPVTVERWAITPPRPDTCLPLILAFPRSLDWAMLSSSITVESEIGETIEGRSRTDQSETQWSFTPCTSWIPGRYRIRVASVLEDPCGNDLLAAFDRPLRSGHDALSEITCHSLAFDVAPLGYAGPYHDGAAEHRDPMGGGDFR